MVDYSLNYVADYYYRDYRNIGAIFMGNAIFSTLRTVLSLAQRLRPRCMVRLHPPWLRNAISIFYINAASMQLGLKTDYKAEIILFAYTFVIYHE
jgi:hypothetical protein